MNSQRFEELFHCDGDVDWTGCNALQGLIIINKYLPKKGIEGANHDVIYSCEVEEIIEAGITESDVVQLRRLNWMTEDSYLACFV